MVGPGVYLPSISDCAPERVQEGCCIVSLRESLTLRPDNQPSSLQARPRFSQTLRQSFQRLQVSFGQPSLFYIPGYFSLDRQLTYKDCIRRVLFGTQLLWTFTRFVSSIRIPFVRHTAARPGQGLLCKALKKKLAPFSVDNCKCLMFLSWWSGRMHLCTFPQLVMQSLLCVETKQTITWPQTALLRRHVGNWKKPRWWFFWWQRVILDWLQRNGKVLTKFILGLLWRTARQKDVLSFEKVDRKS